MSDGLDGAGDRLAKWYRTPEFLRGRPSEDLRGRAVIFMEAGAWIMGRCIAQAYDERLSRVFVTIQDSRSERRHHICYGSVRIPR